MIKNLKILIVDDEPRLCGSLKTLLCAQNYYVKTCSSGNEALTLLTQNEFDLILLDITMEGMDGFQVIENIINQKIDTPVIIMTGNASTQSAIKALRMGARDYLKKPFEPEELYTSVKNIINQRAVERKLNESDKRYEDLVNMIPQGIQITDLDGKIVFSNPAHHKIQGNLNSGLIGKYIWELIEKEDNRIETKEYYNFLIREQPKPELYFTKDRTKDGRIIYTQINWDYIRDSKGKLTGIISVISDITKRRQTEEMLLKSQERYRILVENNPYGIQEIDCNGKILFANAKYHQMLGYKGQNLIGQSVIDIQSPGPLRDELPGYFEMLIKDKPLPTKYYCTNLTKQGEERRMEVAWNYQLDTEKNVTGFISVLTDITDRKKTEKALKLKDYIIDSASSIIATCDFDGNLNFVNPLFLEKTGYNPEEVIGKHFPQFWSVGEYYEEIMNTISKKGKWEGELEINKKDGSKIDVQVSATTIFDENQNPIGLMSSSIDITKRKQMEKKLKRSEEHFRTLVRNIPGASYRCKIDKDWTMLFISDEIETLSGYPKTDFLQNNVRSYASIIHPEDLPIASGIAMEAIDKKEAYAFEYRIITSDGKIRWVYEKGQGVFNKQGEARYLDGVIIDITERKQAEEALLESKQRFQTVADFTYDWENWLASDGSHLYVSPSCKRITGYTPDDFMNNSELMVEIIHPDDKALFTGHKHKVNVSGDIVPIDFRIISKSGDERWIGHVCQTVYSVDGSPLGRRGSNRDITETKKLQEEVLKSQKMESIGTLAGGIAHDFNNLLYVVMGNISLVQDDLKTEIEISKNLQAAEEACIRAKELSAQLITFSKGGDPVKKMMSIDNLLKDTVISVLDGFNLKSNISLADSIRQVNIDDNQIKHAIRNIVVNAKEAMDDNGQLKVSCENIDIPQEGFLTLNQGKYIKISFEDQGCGLSKENLKKIFDPYFSTKDMGADKGQGLGLTISYSIIEKHGGLITVESELETGSIFSIYLPADVSVKKIDLQKTEEKPVSLEIVKQPDTSKGKILLMDDEESIRIFMGQLINRFGYDIETCIEGKEALEVYKKAMESKKPFDAVILDLTNKFGMGGQETMGKLLEIDPDTKGIIITGYSDDPVVTNYRAYGFSDFITKPATKDVLTKVISEVLSKN